MRLALMGPRGSGKTTISYYLAALTGWPLYSLDYLIAYEAGQSIPQMVANPALGWPVFRDIEYEVLKKAVRTDHAILDCGGGVVVDLDPKGEEIFSQRKANLLQQCRTILLWPQAEQVLDAMAGDGSRPVLSSTRSAAEILQRRESWYRQVAHHTIPVEGLGNLGIYQKLAMSILDQCGISYEVPSWLTENS